jgi:FkbM family methyltransferase
LPIATLAKAGISSDVSPEHQICDIGYLQKLPKDKANKGMIQSEAKFWPPHRYIRKFHRRLLELRQRLGRDVKIVDGPYMYRFRCETVREFNRCLKLFSKEPGTVKWINAEVKPGQIFYDIGANIGVYTILAARKTGPEGKVYGFEPHAANFARLIDNVIQNNLQDVVIPCSVAVDGEEGFSHFNYDSSNAGTANSQFSPVSEGGMGNWGGEIAELKYATTIDRLMETGRIQAPHHVKIDVDGNEFRILQGMARLLDSSVAPLTIQVEMNPPFAEATMAFLQARGYNLIEKHYSRSALRRMEQMGDTQKSGGNAIFRKKD